MAPSLVAGVAIGIASTVNPLYISENAPRGIRGFLTGLNQLSIVTGLTVRIHLQEAELLESDERSGCLLD